MTNLFREAQQLLKGKHPLEMSKEELEIVSVAEIPLTILARYNDMTTEEGLEDLARMVGEKRERRGGPDPGAN